jgi:hypothetical protein
MVEEKEEGVFDGEKWFDELCPPKKPRKYRSLETNLRSYKALLANMIFWKSRQNYFELVKSFRDGETDGVTFCSEFLTLRSKYMLKTGEIFEKIEEGIKPIPDLYYTSKVDDFCFAIDALFFDID